MQKQIKYGLIGCGQWGKNYISAINTIGDSLKIVCKKTPTTTDYGCEVVYDYRQVCESDVDVVIVATPPHSHYEIAKCALLNNKHVICEKPFVFKNEQAVELANLASTKNLNLVIDYIHTFNPFFQDLCVESDNERKRNVVVDSVGVYSGPIREDYSALWDFGSHDVAMTLQFFSGFDLIQLRTNRTTLNNGYIYNVTLDFESGNVARLCFGNGGETRVRTFVFGVNGKVKAWNDNFPASPLIRLLTLVKFAILDGGRDASNSNLATRTTLLLEKIERDLVDAI